MKQTNYNFPVFVTAASGQHVLVLELHALDFSLNQLSMKKEIDFHFSVVFNSSGRKVICFFALSLF